MKQTWSTVLNLKVNVVGTIFLALMVSVSTVIATEWLRSSTTVANMDQAPVATASVLECEQGVYSPVQRNCVDQQTFDAEMQRLFAALGLNTSAYGLNNSN